MTEDKQTTALKQAAAENNAEGAVDSKPEEKRQENSERGTTAAPAEDQSGTDDAPEQKPEEDKIADNAPEEQRTADATASDVPGPDGGEVLTEPKAGVETNAPDVALPEQPPEAEAAPAAAAAAAVPVSEPVVPGAADTTENAATTDAEQPQSVAAPAQTTRIRFAELNLDERLHRAIESIGFEFCTPIQAETLPYTLACHDLIGQAQTGTGKTAAFLITAIQTMLETPIPDQERFASEPRVLALAPTRELAMQIAKDAEELCRHTGHRVVSVVGGMNYDKQRDQLQNEIVDILVATPGRLIDFLGSQDVFLDQLDLLILDEADRMLDMGFIPDVKRIIRRCTPKENRQTLLFSATFNQDVLNLASMWTQGAEFIEIEPQQKTAERVKQTVYLVSDDDKLTVLVNCLRDPGVEKAIVFANRRDQCRDLDEDLRNQGVKVALMSGEIAQNKRIKTLDQFKRGDIQVLVATDVAGRGIHVDGVTHVFNYNLPENAEDYVHRIGRTGRAGQNGISVSFAGEDDAFALPAIESYISQKLTTAIPGEDLMAPMDKPKIQRRRGRRPQGGGQGGAGRGRPRPRRN